MVSDDRIPRPGWKVTSDSFADLALAVVPMCPGVTLVMTAMDSQGAKVGPLFVIGGVPEDPRERTAALDQVLSMCFGSSTPGWLTIAYAFVTQNEAGDALADASIAVAYPAAGLN